MRGKNQSRNIPTTIIKNSSSYISLSKSVLGNKKLDRSLTSSTSFTISQQNRFKNRSNYIYETTDLSGEMFKKKFKDPSPTFGNWDNFINKSYNQDRSNKIKLISYQKKLENSLTCRTINPSLVKGENQKVKKGKSTNNLKSLATGSISNLINSTPFEKVYKKETKILNCSNIFTPEYNLPKPKKHMVDLEKIKRNVSYAGTSCDNYNNYFNPEKQPSINYSKNRKITSLKSFIFDPISKVDKKSSVNKTQNLINYSIDIIDNTKGKIIKKCLTKKTEQLSQRNYKPAYLIK